MTNAPQAVTERYVSNLIHNGQNKEFRLVKLEVDHTFVRNQNVGVHYIAQLTNFHATEEGIGATPQQATRNALIAHGVTFR